MPDPFKKVATGDDLVIPAPTWNAMVDAGVAEKNRRFDRDAPARDQSRSSAIIRVKNESGADLPRSSVLGLDAPIFLPADGDDADPFLREVAFRGVAPTITDHRGKFAVTLEPAPVDRVVRAYVAGACPVRLNVLDADHTFAEVEAGVTLTLKTQAVGSAQILWKDDSGGYGDDTVWAVIRFGSGGGDGGGAQAAMTQAGGIPAGVGLAPGSAYVSLCSWNPGTMLFTDTGVIQTCFNVASAVAASKLILMNRVGQDWFVIVEPCG